MEPAASLILALGDSLVAGYGLSQADGFAAQLETRLRLKYPGTTVANAGVSGDTSGDVRHRLPAVLSCLAARPDLAIVQVGPNDVLRQVPPATTRANLSGILVELQRCAIPVLLTTVEPPPVFRDRARPYVGLHQELAAMHGAVTCGFFPAGVLGRADMVLADGIHPNRVAIAAVVEALLPVVERMLANRDLAVHGATVAA